MQRYRGNSYRNSRAAAGGGTRGLSRPQPRPLPPNMPSWQPPAYSPPPRAGNSNFNVPRGFVGGAAAGMTRAGLLGLVFGGAFLLGFGLGRTYRNYFGVGGRWAMMMMGYTEILRCVGPGGICTGTGFALACSATPGFSSPKWDGVTRPAALHSRGNPHFENRDTGFYGTRAVRWSRTVSVNRPNSIPAPNPDPWWEPAPGEDPWTPQPVPNPQVDPLSSPIGEPMPFPQPVPWRAIPEIVPNPYRSPTEQPQRGPSAPPKPRPQPNPDPAPGPKPGSQPKPAPQPLPGPVSPPQPVPEPPPVVIQPGPGGNPVPSPQPAPKPRFAPPRPGEKEKKARSNNARFLMGAANYASEFGDLVGAIWKALPREYRSKPRWDPYQKKWFEVGGIQKMRDIYENFEHVDQEQMWANIVNEMAEDFAYGSLGQALKNANRKLGFRPNFIGLGAGPAL